MPTGAKKKQVGWEQQMTTEMDEEEDGQDQFGFKREKSECKLLQSQIAIMQDIFEQLDKYNDGILRRSQFVMAMRTDERIVDFIDVDAVKVPYSQRILTLDEVFVEVEKDETHLKSFYKSTCSIEVPRLTDEESVDLVNIRVAIKSSQLKYIKLNVKQRSYCYGVP
jgi:hypothetical protein